MIKRGRSAICAAACAGAWLASPAAAAMQKDAIVVLGARARPFDAAPVPDAALAGMRGGLLLPNGLDVAIGIDIQTRVDGVLALHTLYSTDGPSAGVRVFTDGTAAVPAAPGTVTVDTSGDDNAPSITVSRAPTGTTIAVDAPDAPVKINVVSGAPSTWPMAAGETPVAVTENGPAVSTAGGQISLATNAQGSVVTLNAPMLQIQQIVGQATGVILANSGNDRMISTIGAVNIDLHGLSADMVTALALGDRLALAVAAAR